jgi:hypothetical protein
MKPRNGDVVIIDKNATTIWKNSRCVVSVANNATKSALVKVLKDSQGNYVHRDDVEIWVAFSALHVVFTRINFEDLINMALDKGDKEWFLEITDFKKHYDKALFGGAHSGKK